MTALPAVVPAEEWEKARAELLAAEKAATRAQDRLAAQRRRLPMVRFGEYTFASPTGPVTLLELFGEQQQLALYQFMHTGPDRFCPGCTAFTRNVPDLSGLANRGVAWATVSDMPLPQMTGYWERMGWRVPYASSAGTTFSADSGAGGGFVLNVFLRDDDTVYRTYSTYSRGVDRLLFENNILDLAPYGRQEEWEDSPADWPQHPTYG